MKMLRNLLRLARITSAGKDADNVPIQQMEYLGKVADGVIVLPYGLHANVPADIAAIMMALQGNPENRYAIPFNTDKRPKLAAGEVAFFHPPTDAFIIWRASGELDIETGNGGTADINIKAANVNITAAENVNITAIEDITLTGANVNINP